MGLPVGQLGPGDVTGQRIAVEPMGEPVGPFPEEGDPEPAGSAAPDASVSPSASTAMRDLIDPDDILAGAARYGDLVFTAGFLGLAEGDDFDADVNDALDQLEATLSKSGAGFDTLVKVRRVPHRLGRLGGVQPHLPAAHRRVRSPASHDRGGFATRAGGAHRDVRR